MTISTPEEEKEILVLFFKLAEETLLLMENSRRENERTDWKAAAHYLKVSSANLGMTSLADACKKAEQSTAHTYEEASRLLQNIRTEIMRVREFLQF